MNVGKTTILKTSRIVVQGRGFLTGHSLVIRNGCFGEVTPEPARPPEVEIMDCEGLAVSPLFCDYHLHFSQGTMARAEEVAEELLRHGIGMVFEGGDRHMSGVEMRGVLEGRIAVRTAGYALFRKGTYGSAIGRAVGGPAEARKVIGELQRQGIDYIKVINSGVFMPALGGISKGGFNSSEIREIIDCARGWGLPVFCHANGAAAVREAVAAGASVIIHGLGITGEILSEMAERGVTFIPTVNAFRGLMKISSDAEEMGIVERAVAGHLEAVMVAFEKGVKVLPGSDSGPSFLPYGETFRLELDHFRKAGLPLDKILSSAAAGTFVKGSDANFLVLDGLNIRSVYIRGKRVG